MNLTPRQLKVLRLLTDSSTIIRPGGEVEIRPPPDSSGPFSGRDAPTWTALEKLGLVERKGFGTVQSGNFSWRMPSYRVTAAGRALTETAEYVAWLDGVHARELDFAGQVHAKVSS